MRTDHRIRHRDDYLSLAVPKEPWSTAVLNTITMKRRSSAGTWLLLISLPAAHGQSALPFPPDGEHLLWKYSLSGGMLLNSCDQFEYAGEEVELDGHVYALIRRSHRYEVHTGPGTFYIDEAYGAEYCHLRTDSEGVTYIHSTGSPPEEVLFDPAIGIGDTVPPTWKLIRRDWYDETVTVEDITTLLDEQGVARRVWHLHTPYYPWTLTFTEGVGSSNWFLGLASGSGAPESGLVCVRYDGAAIMGTTCTSINSVPDVAEADNDPLRVTALPSTGGYQLNRTCSGTLFDVVGRPVRQLQNASEFRLDGIAGGAYTLLSEEYGIARFFHP